VNQEIHFSSINGLAPSYVAPNGTVYIITDEKTYGKRRYTLKAKTKAPYITYFSDKESVEKYIEELTCKRRYEKYKFSEQTGYFMADVILAVTGLTVKKIYTPDIVAGPYDSYAECLEFAKKYIGGFLSDAERIRISLM